jgi:hypothetical protein
LKAASIAASRSCQTRIRVALIAVSQSGRATLDAKIEASMASTIVASQPRKTTIKETSIAVSQARKEVALVWIVSCVHRLIVLTHLNWFRETTFIIICLRLSDVRCPYVWASTQQRRMRVTKRQV